MIRERKVAPFAANLALAAYQRRLAEQLDIEPGAELKTAARNKTSLVIAHRLSTVVDAHEILVLANGEIVERGSHADLVGRLGGVYAEMWALQQASQE